MNELISRVPPSNAEAEQSILGAMLQSEECVHMAIERLKREDFYLEFNRRIWDAILDLTNAYMPVDIVTVTERLGRANLSLDDLTYLSNLTQLVPSVRNLPSYIDIVREKSIMRKLLAVCGEVSEMCYKSEERASDIINYASSEIYRISQGKESRSLMHIHTALVEAYELINKAAFSKDGLMGVAIGFPMLDRMLSGFQASQLIIIAGRPGMGKTSFALNIVENVALSTNRPVAFFSLEMSRDQLAMRLMCSGASVDSQLVRSGKLPVDDYFTLTDAMVPLEKSSIYIDDTPTIGPSEILSKSRRLKQEKKRPRINSDRLSAAHDSLRQEQREQTAGSLRSHPFSQNNGARAGRSDSFAQSAFQSERKEREQASHAVGPERIRLHRAGRRRRAICTQRELLLRNKSAHRQILHYSR